MSFLGKASENLGKWFYELRFFSEPFVASFFIWNIITSQPVFYIFRIVTIWSWIYISNSCLHRCSYKEFVTVLDFIGNYKKSFLMAIALNGKQDYDRDSLKLEVANDFADLPNGTYIHMDKITKEQILRQLENEKFMSLKYMKESYFSFKHACGGKVPFLVDYLKHDGSIDPVRFTVFSQNYKTYFEFAAYIEKESHPEFSLMNEDETFSKIMRLLSFYSPAKRAEEWIIAETVFNSENYFASVDEIAEKAKKYLSFVKKTSIVHACQTLSGTYFDSREKPNYEKAIFDFDRKTIFFNKNTVNSIENSEFSAQKKLWLEDLSNTIFCVTKTNSAQMIILKTELCRF